MILMPQKKFDGYVVERLRESCGYREVYDAKYDDKPVVLTVYDVERTPPGLFSDVLLCGGKKMPREAWVLSKVTGEQFPRMIASGMETVGGRELAFFGQEFFMAQTLADKPVDSITNNLEKMSELVKAVVELAQVCGGGHFNICPQTVMVSGTCGDVKPMVRVAGLDHAGECSNGKPWFDTGTLNHCCRPPESFMGLFDSSADVYALGMVMAYMFTCKYPYPVNERMSPREVLDAVKRNQPRLNGIPELFRPIISRAIEKKAALRFRSVGDFAYQFYKLTGRPSSQPDHSYNPVDRTPPMSEETRLPQQAGGASLKVSIGVQHGKGLGAVAGMDALKDTLRTDFVDIVKHRGLAQSLGIEPPNMILYGPPGNGKTYVVERLAEECGMEYCYVQPSSLGSIYIHGSQTMIAELFAQAEQKAKNNPRGCLLMIDEIDAVCPTRTEDDTNHQAGEVAEFLTQLNNCVKKNVFVIGATNRIGSVDRAILRAGRIEQVIYVGLPDDKCRKELFDLELHERPHSPDIDTTVLAQKTEGYTAADIAKIVKVSSRRIFRACLDDSTVAPEITQQCIERAIGDCRPSVNATELKEYERQRDEFNANGVSSRRKIGF